MRIHGDMQLGIAISVDNAAIVLGHLIGQRLGTWIDIDVHKGEDTVALALTDDGPGIPEPNRSRIFDAFFTTKRDSGATGMGLTIVRSVIEAHGGTIALEPSRTGCRFEIELPF